MDNYCFCVIEDPGSLRLRTSAVTETELLHMFIDTHAQKSHQGLNTWRQDGVWVQWSVFIYDGFCSQSVHHSQPIIMEYIQNNSSLFSLVLELQTCLSLPSLLTVSTLSLLKVYVNHLSSGKGTFALAIQDFRRIREVQHEQHRRPVITHTHTHTSVQLAPSKQTTIISVTHSHSAYCSGERPQSSLTYWLPRSCSNTPPPHPASPSRRQYSGLFERGCEGGGGWIRIVKLDRGSVIQCAISSVTRASGHMMQSQISHSVLVWRRRSVSCCNTKCVFVMRVWAGLEFDLTIYFQSFLCSQQWRAHCRLKIKKKKTSFYGPLRFTPVSLPPFPVPLHRAHLVTRSTLYFTAFLLHLFFLMCHCLLLRNCELTLLPAVEMSLPLKVEPFPQPCCQTGTPPIGVSGRKPQGDPWWIEIEIQTQWQQPSEKVPIFSWRRKQNSGNIFKECFFPIWPNVYASYFIKIWWKEQVLWHSQFWLIHRVFKK